MNIEDKGEDLYMDLPDPQVCARGYLPPQGRWLYSQAMRRAGEGNSLMLGRVGQTGARTRTYVGQGWAGRRKDMQPEQGSLLPSRPFIDVPAPSPSLPATCCTEPRRCLTRRRGHWRSVSSGHLTRRSKMTLWTSETPSTGSQPPRVSAWGARV